MTPPIPHAYVWRRTRRSLAVRSIARHNFAMPYRPPLLAAVPCHAIPPSDAHAPPPLPRARKRSSAGRQAGRRRPGGPRSPLPHVILPGWGPDVMGLGRCCWLTARLAVRVAGIRASKPPLRRIPRQAERAAPAGAGRCRTHRRTASVALYGRRNRKH